MATIQENIDTIRQQKVEIKQVIEDMGYGTNVKFTEMASVLSAAANETKQDVETISVDLSGIRGDISSIQNGMDRMSADISSTNTFAGMISSEMNSKILSTNLNVSGVSAILGSVSSEMVSGFGSVMDEISSLDGKFIQKDSSQVGQKDMDGVEVIDGCDLVPDNTLSIVHEKYFYINNWSVAQQSSTTYDTVFIKCEPNTQYSFSKTARFLCYLDSNMSASVSVSLDNQTSASTPENTHIMALAYNKESDMGVAKGLDGVKSREYSVPEWLKRGELSTKQDLDRADIEILMDGSQKSFTNMFDFAELLSEHGVPSFEYDGFSRKFKV